MTVCSTSKSSYWLLNCDVLISNIHDFAGLSMRWPRVALITRRRVALAACRLRGPHFLHMECHKQHLSMHCVLPLSPSSVSSQPLLHEKTAERIPAFNNSSLVYPLSIRQNPINLCSIESFTFWIIYIYIYYIYISFSDCPRQYLSRTGIQNENGVWLKQVDILWSFLPSIQAFYEFVSVSVSVLGGSPAFPKPECLHLKKFHWIWSIIYQSSEVIRSGPQSHCCHCSFLSIAGGGGGNGGPGERGEISPRGLGCEVWPKGSAAVVLWRFCKQYQAIKR